MKRKYIFIIGIIMLLVLVSVTIIRKQKKSTQQHPLPFLDTSGKSPLVSCIKTLTNQGGRVDWSPKGDLIAFDRLGDDGYWDMWVMNSDGSSQRCITCNNLQVPQKNNGNPAWSSDGKWLAFQAVNPNLQPKSVLLRRPKIEREITHPGSGIYSNAWVMDFNANKFYQLTDVDNKGGILHPHFSHDVKKLVWTERLGPSDEDKMGEWAIKMADFVVVNGTPKLENIKTYQPGERPKRFYEVHGFTLDDQQLIYSGRSEPSLGGYAYQIYILDLATQKVTRLTNSPNNWYEHANLSPDGEKIAYMSTEDYGLAAEIKKTKAEVWLMNIDGSDKKRLTFFNDPTAPEYIPLPDGAYVGDMSWNPDGSKLLVSVKTDREKRTGPIVVIDIK